MPQEVAEEIKKQGIEWCKFFKETEDSLNKTLTDSEGTADVYRDIDNVYAVRQWIMQYLCINSDEI